MISIRRLVKKAQNGDENAYLELFQAYEADIYRMAFVYVKNKEDALDVVQEVAYRSFKNIKTLKKPEYLKTWLIKITINCSVNLLRANRKVIPLKPEYEQSLKDEEEDIPLAVSLHEIMNVLQEDEKSAVLLKYYHDYTFQEVSEILNIPLGTAKSLMYRALKKLRKEWKGEDVVER